MAGAQVCKQRRHPMTEACKMRILHSEEPTNGSPKRVQSTLEDIMKHCESGLRILGVLALVATLAACESGDTGEMTDTTGMAGTAETGPQQASEMSFFITSAGPGDGANLGGLEGADAHCRMLAEEVDAGAGTWRAYLSTQATDDQEAENARDRIGSGPWHNAEGVIVAQNVEDLHGENNNLGKQTSLDEHGNVVNGRGDDPNRHDILTGSQLDGTAFSDEEDHTCQNWTSNGEGSAEVGHHDREGGGANPTSWNSAHASSGCSQSDLQGTGGDGLFYCFAAN